MGIFSLPGEGRLVRDKQWVRNSFLLASKNNTSKDEAQWRLQTQADIGYTDTRIGGGFALNNPPQYTRYADIKYGGVNAANIKDVGSPTVRGEHLGMGRVYKEQIEQNRQLIHMQFGVPEYNGMVSFFTSFFDGDASLLASEGRASISYYVGRAAGTVLSVAVLVAFPWLLFGFGLSAAASFFLESPSSKYYYMRESMALYWNRVNFIANSIAVNMGIVPRVFRSDGPLIKEQNADFTPEYNQYMYKVAPDLFRENGGVDVYAIANKAQRLADERHKAIKAAAEAVVDNTERLRLMQAALKAPTTYSGTARIEDALKEYHESGLGDTSNKRADPAGSRLTKETDIATIAAEQAPTTPATNPDGSPAPTPPPTTTPQKVSDNPSMRSRYVTGVDADGQPTQTKEPGYFEKFADSYMANRREGNKFLTFGVDYTGPVQESFSNSVRESDISSKVNGFSSSSRSTRFSFSEGNTGIGMIDEVKSSIAGFVAGALDSIHMSGLLSLAGSAFVDIPKHFDTASATFPTSSYTVELRSWSGDKLSRYLNLFIPLSTLLAAALPLSTGKQSYTAPFLCRLYSRGKNQIQLGMITSLSITRGAGNIGFGANGECLGIDVSFEIANLSSVMHAPIEPGSVLPWKNILDEDSAWSDYMAVLGNLSMSDQIYKTDRLFLNLTRKREMYATALTPAAIANATEQFWPTRYVGYLIGAVARSGERGSVL